ncbi:DUF6274 family protein [Streptomyces sp. NPDC018031]|uniref:DUF6274 family protein n=1 Tax=Streptomyces sp. NPDC018031 TaxID=3365033 RepID=UPI0037B6BB8B
MTTTARREIRALLRAHLSAAAGRRHSTRHCPVCHRLLRLAMQPAPPERPSGRAEPSGPSGGPTSPAGPDEPSRPDCARTSGARSAGPARTRPARTAPEASSGGGLEHPGPPPDSLYRRYALDDKPHAM